MWNIYKEDQGKVIRILLVTVIMLGAVFALQQLHGYLGSNSGDSRNLPGLIDVFGRIFGFIDWRYIVHGPLILLAAMFASSIVPRPLIFSSRLRMS